MVNIKSSVIDGGEELEIYAPVSMTLNAYAYYQFGSDNPEWALVFTVNSEITIRMTHITEVVSKIIDGTTTIPQNSSAEYPPSKTVTFAAGEQIGATTGTSQAHNWNIYVYDTRNENQYAQQERYLADYLGERLRNGVCPFDYYDSEMMSEYYALLGASAPGQSSTCGTVSRDVAGTLAGQWHFNPDPGMGVLPPALDGVYASPLAIYTTSDGKVNIYTIDLKRQEISSDHPTYKDPEAITTTHCYELTDIFYNPEFSR